jgi:hypothetical protein
MMIPAKQGAYAYVALMNTWQAAVLQRIYDNLTSLSTSVSSQVQPNQSLMSLSQYTVILSTNNILRCLVQVVGESVIEVRKTINP